MLLFCKFFTQRTVAPTGSLQLFLFYQKFTFFLFPPFFRVNYGVRERNLVGGLRDRSIAAVVFKFPKFYACVSTIVFFGTLFRCFLYVVFWLLANNHIL